MRAHTHTHIYSLLPPFLSIIHTQHTHTHTHNQRRLTHSPGSLAGCEELVPAQVCSYPSAHLCLQLWLALIDELLDECLVDSQGNLDISQSFEGEDGSHVTGCRTFSCISLVALVQFEQCAFDLHDSWS